MDGAVLILILGAIYFLPMIIAHNPAAPNGGVIAVINVFLGWTFIGWLVALALAFADRKSDS